MIAIAGAASAQIQWRSGPEALQARATQAETHAALTELAARPNRRHIVVQFEGPITQEGRDKLRNAGVRLLNYVGDHAYFAAIEPELLNTRALDADAPRLLAVGEIETHWKMDPFFLTGQTPDWALVGPGIREGGKADPVIGAYLVFHADIPLAPITKAIVEAHGAVIRDEIQSVKGLVIEAPLSAIERIAEEDIVQYIEPALPRMSTLNAENRIITQVDTVQASPYGLSGAGVSVMVYDGGTGNSTHNDFGGRHTNRDTDGLSDHATHVAGTVGGNGANSSGEERGMAPGVTIQAYG
ncbi:MAG: hypothetical protein VYC34_08425, partial [Planctomycetota bacterium]|nr:hypothetical protein [Planctomycetota bacterium]